MKRRTPIKVLLVDDHAVVREGLRAILETTKEVQCCEACSGEDALTMVAQDDTIQVILLDVSLPRMGGLEVLNFLHEHYPQIRVLVLSLYPEEQYTTRCLRMGAKGYLSKSAPSKEIVEAILCVAAGKEYLPNPLYGRFAKVKDTSGDAPLHEGLSNREFEIMCLLGAGKSVSEIAELLSLSVKTVSTYRERILEKMGFAGNFEIMRYVLTEGLLK